ncbi:4-phosphoerythronate dehydrogenase [Oceanospirillaceae bacterium]|nr:4-phosphoerythronate dehydrogenase [Oceanospirillaceae bacterium]
MGLINLVVDENILLLDELFGDLASITRVDGRSITKEQVANADALVLRSTAKVTAKLLAGSKVQFVGTCTIGVDHLDTNYMDANDIIWRNAPGCNAAGVGDYVIACLNHAWQTLDIDPRQQTIGIVGAGNVGGRLAQRLINAGFDLLQCDPLRADAGQEGYVALDELLSRCQIICLHAPLTKAGEHATENLLHEARIKSLCKGTVLISAGRGEVVDQAALLMRQQEFNDLHLFMDVWHQEPHIDRGLFDYCHCVTPHIAGHSLEGKMRGTYMIYEDLCKHFSLPIKHSLDDLIPKPALEEIVLNSNLTTKECLLAACDSVYPLMEDDARMRKTSDFDLLRKTYPVRREFASLQLHGINESKCAALLGGLGFNVNKESN